MSSMDGYDVGQLIAEVWVDTSTMSEGIQASTSVLQGLQTKVEQVAKGIDNQTKVIQRSFNTMSAGMELHLDAMIELTQAVKNGFAQLGVRLESVAQNGQRQLQGMSTGFRNVREGVDHVTQSLQRMQTSTAGVEQVTTAVRRLSSAMSGASANSEGLFQKLSRISLFGYILYQDLRFAAEGISRLFAPGAEFAVSMENAQIGMAAIMTSSFKDATGADVEFTEALKASKGVMADMRGEALRTTATMEELVTTFQAILGPGVEKGMTLQEIEKITVLSVNAVKAMGLRKDQLVQEIRSILTENITARSSTVATALGITNKDIQEAQTKIGGVAKLLEERFKGFQLMANETEDTFMALWTNIEDGLQQTQMKAFEPFFRKVKDGLKDVQGLFFNIKKYEEDVYDKDGRKIHSAGDTNIGEIELNPRTVELFREMGRIVEKVYDDLRGWWKEFSNNYDKMQYVKDVFSTISQLTKGIYDNFVPLSKIIMYVWGISGGFPRLVLALAAAMEKLPPLIQFIADHIETLAILWASWCTVSTIIPAIMKVVVALAEVKAAVITLGIVSTETFALMQTRFVASLATMVGAANTSFAAIGLASLRCLGIVGLVVGGIWALVSSLIAAKNAAKEVGAEYNKDFMRTGLQDVQQDAANQKTPSERGRARVTSEDMRKWDDQKVANDAEEATKKAQGWSAKYPHEEKQKKEKHGLSEAQREELAEIDADAKEAVEIEKRKQKELDVQYQEGILNIESYYRQMRESRIKEIEIEKESISRKMAVVTAGGKEWIKYQGELNKLSVQQDTVAAELEKKRLKDYKQFISEMVSLHAEYLSKVGDISLEARMEQTYEKMKKNMLDMENFAQAMLEVKADNNSTAEDIKRADDMLALIRRRKDEMRQIIAIEVADIGLQTTARQLKVEELKLQPALNQLEWEKKNNLISELDYKQQIYDMDTQKLKELLPIYEQQYAYLQFMYEGTKDPKYLEQMDALREKVRALKHDMTALNETIRSTFHDGISDIMTSMLNGTKSFSAGLNDMIKSLQNVFFKQIGNDMANGISNLMFGKMKRPNDGFSDPETKKRVEVMVGEMKVAGNKLFDVFQDSALQVKTAVVNNLVPQLNLLAKKISEITGVPVNTPTATDNTSKTGGDSKLKANSPQGTQLAPMTVNTADPNKARDKEVEAVRASTEKFKTNAAQLSYFAGALAVVSGNEGLMKFATTLQLIIQLMQSMQAVGMLGGVGKSDGGLVTGPGTSTSDSIHTRLSNGEYVVRAAAVKKLGTSFLDSVNRGRLPIARAEGGIVSASVASATSGAGAGTGAGDVAPQINFTLSPSFHSLDPKTNQKVFEAQLPAMRRQIIDMMKSDPAFRNAVKGAVR